MDPALLAGVDDTDDKDTIFAGVHNEDTSLAGVPVPNTTVMTNGDDDSNTEYDHNSMRPTTIQARHPYTAPEATYAFTVPLVNQHNILQMMKPIFLKIKLSWTRNNYPS